MLPTHQKIEVTVRGDVRVLSVKHGDRILIAFKERLPRQHVVDVREQIQALFPNNEVIVLAATEAVAILPANSDQVTRLG